MYFPKTSISKVFMLLRKKLKSRYKFKTGQIIAHVYSHSIPMAETLQ